MGKRWTQEELRLLDEWSGTYTVATIAKKLGRSFNAVNIKMNRIGISGFQKRTELLTMNQVCIMLGNKKSSVIKNTWRKKGLRISRKGNFVVIRQQDLIKYMKEHPEDWNAAKVTDDSLFMSYQWYKDKRKADIERTRHQYFWTEEELSRLLRLRHEGYFIREIAEMMGRSETSIKYKLYQGRNKKHVSIGR